MPTIVSDIEAAILAKHVQRSAVARATIASSQSWLRLPAFLVCAVGFPLVGGYGGAISNYLGTGRGVPFILLALIGLVLLLGAEVIALRRRMDALASLLAVEERAA